MNGLDVPQFYFHDLLQIIKLTLTLKLVVKIDWLHFTTYKLLFTTYKFMNLIAYLVNVSSHGKKIRINLLRYWYINFIIKYKKICFK